MIWLARLAVLVAAATTLTFNGLYALTAADSLHGKMGFVAMALAIDLCKITFLGTASWCWMRGLKLRAVALLMLWPLAFAMSTFMAYASITTQKDGAAAITEGQVQDRSRLQQRYDRAAAALATAQRAPEWIATASCTAAKTKSHRLYCANIANLQNAADDLATQLGPSPVLTARQDVPRLAENTGLSIAFLTFLAALLPALLLELIASLGSYAVGPQGPAKPPRNAAGAFSETGPAQSAEKLKNAPGRDSGAWTGRAQADPSLPAPPRPKFPKVPSVKSA